MSLDPDHPMRGEFNNWVTTLADELQNSAEYRRWGEQLRQSLIENEDLQNYLLKLWADLAERLEADLTDPESAIRRQLGDLLESLADELAADPQMQEWVNRWLVESAVTLVDENRYCHRQPDQRYRQGLGPAGHQLPGRTGDRP